MHPAPLIPDPPENRPRPTKTEVRGGAASREAKAGERATSSEEELMLLGDSSEEEPQS